MKYLTKQWYKTMEKMGMHLMFKTTKQAEVFSESYFEDLYKKEEQEWLKSKEDLANINIEDVFPEEFNLVNMDGTPISSEEFEEVKNHYFKEREQIINNYHPEPFNLIGEKNNFKKSLKFNINQLRERLPTEILQKVADIRVLALNIASAEVKKEIAIYSKVQEKSMKDTLKAYEKYYSEAFAKNEPAFAKMNFHDSTVISCRKKGKDLILDLDKGVFKNTQQIIFKNCTIIEKEKTMHGAWWLYNEIYKINTKYEIHVLLQNKHMELFYFTVQADEIIYKHY